MSRLAVTETFLPVGSEALIAWHGDAPRLAVADEDSRYVDAYITTVGFGYPAVVTAPTSISAPAMDFTVQVWSPQPMPYVGVNLYDRSGPGVLGTYLLLTEANAGSSTPTPASTWVTRTFHLTAGVDYNQVAVEAALAGGTLAVLGIADGTVGNQTAKWSQIVVDIGGPVTYLRNHARDDGLGGNAPRNHPRTSQQRSLRNKGYR